ncbi:MAG TPA: hypothetical protein VH008_09950 [Pseudonocardia sp.]|nr:hypothetical protein [Pseudonocardia sp.]
MSYRDWIPWTPGRRDTGQVDEVTREHAVFKLFVAGLDEQERCRRAIRATELERVAAETHRATAALAVDEWSPTADVPFAVVHRKIINSRLATTMAALNLMGIQTLLPGEPPFDATRDLPDGTRIYLREPTWHHDSHTTPAEDSPDLADGLDALSGLLGDFKRSTIFLSGIRIQPKRVGNVEALALVAVHRTIMSAFGDFLGRKYVMEGWSLV